MENQLELRAFIPPQFFGLGLSLTNVCILAAISGFSYGMTCTQDYMAKQLGVSRKTISSALRKFRGMGILREVDGALFVDSTAPCFGGRAKNMKGLQSDMFASQAYSHTINPSTQSDNHYVGNLSESQVPVVGNLSENATAPESECVNFTHQCVNFTHECNQKLHAIINTINYNLNTNLFIYRLREIKHQIYLVIHQRADDRIVDAFRMNGRNLEAYERMIRERYDLEIDLAALSSPTLISSPNQLPKEQDAHISQPEQQTIFASSLPAVQNESTGDFVPGYTENPSSPAGQSALQSHLPPVSKFYSSKDPESLLEGRPNTLPADFSADDLGLTLRQLGANEDELNALTDRLFRYYSGRDFKKGKLRMTADEFSDSLQLCLERERQHSAVKRYRDKQAIKVRSKKSYWPRTKSDRYTSVDGVVFAEGVVPYECLFTEDGRVLPRDYVPKDGERVFNIDRQPVDPRQLAS